MNEFRFADAWWLLLSIPLIATLLWRRRQRSPAVLYSSVRLLDGLPLTFAQRLRPVLAWSRGFGLALLVLALARPQWGLSEFRITAEGIAIMMCLDRSGSMEALDFEIDGERVNRLEVVKNVFRDFVVGTDELAGRPNDLIGLVTFGGFAVSQAPLTLDHEALVEILKSVEIAQPVYDARGNLVNEPYLEQERATAIGDAVALAVDRLQASSAKSKVIILLSDGENTAGIIDPLAAAEAAKALGVKIHAIGIGTTGRVPFPIDDPTGRRQFTLRRVRLDEATLRRLAETTGGEYFNAEDTNALRRVYSEIDRLEKTEAEGALYSEYRELFPWFLFPAIGALLLEMMLRATRLRGLP